MERMRRFVAEDGVELHLELESSGRVSWRVQDAAGRDCGGDSYKARGEEGLRQAAEELLSSGQWQEI